MKREPVSIVVPSYNGKELLERYLPSVVGSLEEYPGGGEIIVVEDGGDDGTAQWLKSEMKDVKVLVHDTNRGFAHAANCGVEAALNEAVLLLNLSLIHI